MSLEEDRTKIAMNQFDFAPTHCNLVDSGSRVEIGLDKDIINPQAVNFIRRRAIEGCAKGCIYNVRGVVGDLRSQMAYGQCEGIQASVDALLEIHESDIGIPHFSLQVISETAPCGLGLKKLLRNIS